MDSFSFFFFFFFFYFKCYFFCLLLYSVVNVSYLFLSIFFYIDPFL